MNYIDLIRNNYSIFSNGNIKLNTGKVSDFDSDPNPDPNSDTNTPPNSDLNPKYIDLNIICPNLLQFAVISLIGPLNTSTTNTPILIKNGYWYGPEDSSNISGLIGEGSLSGYNGNPAYNEIYFTEFLTLMKELNYTTREYKRIPITNTHSVFFPNYIYESTNDMEYGPVTLIFNANGNPDAQFFINPKSFTFDETLFVLKDGAQSSNIFWLTSGNISITNCSVPGIIICGPENTTSVKFNGNPPMTLNCHIFSIGGISMVSDYDKSEQLIIESDPVSIISPTLQRYIDLNVTCPNLLEFAVYARNNLNTEAITDINKLIIKNGHWFGNPVVGFNILGDDTFGYNNDPKTNTIYWNEFINLTNEINNITNTYIQIKITNTDITSHFLPNYSYITENDIEYGNILLTFDAKGNPDAQFFISANSFTFNETVFDLINGAQSSNIFWSSKEINDELNVKNFTIINSSVPGIIQCSPIKSETIIISNNNSNMTLKGHIFSFGSIICEISSPNREEISRELADEPIYITIDSTPIPITPSLATTHIVSTPPIVCYAKGTLILTKHGFVPIENMKVGDKVVTNGKIYNNKIVKRFKTKSETVLWVGKFKVNKLNNNSRPICITKNSFDVNFPIKDLYVSPNHSMIIDGEMVLAKDLVNEVTIYQDMECENVEYYHLECENHSTIIANGVLSESYLNMDNRSVFENSVKIHPKKYMKSEMTKILSL